MADIAKPEVSGPLPAESFYPILIRFQPKLSVAPTKSDVLQVVELPKGVSVYVKLTMKEVFSSPVGGKLVKYTADVLLLNAKDNFYQLFQHGVLKNMDYAKSSMSFAGAAAAEATRSCHLVMSGNITLSGKKVTLAGSEYELDLVDNYHLKGEKGVFCFLGRQFSVPVQGCDKSSWVCKEGSSECALQECANLLK